MEDKQKTAFSVMSGLRQKFARERGKGKSYSADELHLIFSESINRINSREEIILDQSEVWDDVNEQIEKSGIRRFPWKRLFGTSLTEVILTYKKNGFDPEETIDEIEKDPALKNFIESNPQDKEKILENIRISVHARFGENETAKKVMNK